jgi:hypothetical protein
MNPTEKNARFDKLRELGCICCFVHDHPELEDLALTPTGLHVEIHHLNENGKAGAKRRGDEFTIPLCWHHHKSSFNGLPAPSGWAGLQWMDAKAAIHGPGLAGHSRQFRAVYGTDDELLALVNSLIAPIPYTLTEAK